ncbi:MAG: hypothetical protein WC405_20525 [Syntrophales bacterium]
MKNIAEIVRVEKTEKGELKKENAELREANQATSEKFQESVRQFVKELQYPLSAIYELRWNRHRMDRRHYPSMVESPRTCDQGMALVLACGKIEKNTRGPRSSNGFALR